MKRLILLSFLLAAAEAFAVFPQVASVTETTDTTPDSTYDMDLDATVDAGDLLACSLTVETVQTTWDSPAVTGWTTLLSDININAQGASLIVIAKDADGTEDGATISISGDTSGETASQCYRITAASWGGNLATDVDISTLAEASGTAPDPPSVTAGGGSADNLFIEFANFADDAETLDTCSTNYSNLVSTVADGGANASASVGSCRRELAAASDDPGVMALSATANSGAYTIVVAPAAATNTSLRRRRGN